MPQSGRGPTRPALAICVIAGVVALAALAGFGGPTAAPSTRAAAALPAVPATWPFDRLELGFADSPGGAAALHAPVPFGMRYQYLAGGVNTGDGWATWNTDGQFVTWYVEESVDAGMLPVFPYYMLLQSQPATGATESARDLSNLRNTTTMAAYWDDVRLFLQRAAAGAGGTPVVLHVEPDLWGYIEQAATNDSASDVPAAVASSGDPELAGLPNTAAGFAQAFVRLRDAYAPSVLLAYHVSVWGTGIDLHVSQTSNAETDALAAQAAAFYGTLGADFDLAFVDLSDRDSGFYQAIYGDGGASWWNASDFPRYGRFVGGFAAAAHERVVVWQIPMGNTVMRATNGTWGHYADNRPEWFLADVGDGHLAAWRDAGVIGLLFGGGAGGTTCACDAMGDGVSNPAASGTHTRTSLSADDDGGYLRDRSAAYYAAGGLAIDAGGPGPTPSPSPTAAPTSTPPSTATPSPSGTPAPSSTPSPTGTPSPSATPAPSGTPGPTASPTPGAGATWTVTATRSPARVHRGHRERITVTVAASDAVTALVDVELADPGGRKVAQRWWDGTAFDADVPRTFTWRWRVGAHRPLGRWTVRVGVFEPGWTGLLTWRDAVVRFRVLR